MPLTGTTVYITSTGRAVVLVNASSAKALAAKPVPTAGLPAAIARPFKLSAVIL